MTNQETECLKAAKAKRPNDLVGQFIIFRTYIPGPVNMEGFAKFHGIGQIKLQKLCEAVVRRDKKNKSHFLYA